MLVRPSPLMPQLVDRGDSFRPTKRKLASTLFTKNIHYDTVQTGVMTAEDTGHGTRRRVKGERGTKETDVRVLSKRLVSVSLLFPPNTEPRTLIDPLLDTLLSPFQ